MTSVAVVVGLLLASGGAVAGVVKRRRARVRGLLRAADHEELLTWARAAGYEADDASDPALAESGQRICDLAGELGDERAFVPPTRPSLGSRRLTLIARRAAAGHQLLLLEYTSHLGEPHSIGALTTRAHEFSATLERDAAGTVHREGRLPELERGASFDEIVAELGAPSRIRFAGGHVMVAVPGTLSADRGRRLEQWVLDIERRLAQPTVGPAR